MKWIDLCDIVIELCDKFFDVDFKIVCFIDLYCWIMELEDFEDDLNYFNEKIFEVVILCWMDEFE